MSKKNAEKENIVPRFTDADMHFNYLAIPRDPDAAVKWWTEFAVRMTKGIAWRDSAVKRINTIQFHSPHEYASSALMDAIQFHSTPKDYEAAFKWYSIAAKQGEVYAEHILGVMHTHGCGVLQDYKAAFKWFTSAAEKGHPEAQFQLGWMYEYETSECVPQDHEAAFKWWSLAAEQGHSEAMYSVGWMHEQGVGVSQHYVRAYMWFDLADSFNNGSSYLAVEDLAKKMTSDQIEKAKKLAVYWREKVNLKEVVK